MAGVVRMAKAVIAAVMADLDMWILLSCPTMPRLCCSLAERLRPEIIEQGIRRDSGSDDACANRIENPEGDFMRTDPDPFEQGQRAAREGIFAEGNPYQDGTEQHALWAAGHEQVASTIEATESEET